MSAKSAMNTRFSLVSVPSSMRPTAESIEKMGKRIGSQIRSNDAMRIRSLNNAKRPVN